MTTSARLAKDVYVRLWPQVRQAAPTEALRLAALAIEELSKQHPEIAAIPNLPLRLSLAAGVQAVAEELALCPGATPFQLLPARMYRSLQGLFRPEMKDLRERAWAFGALFASDEAAAGIISQMTIGNWVAKAVGLDHRDKANQNVVLALGRAALVNGVRITDDLLSSNLGASLKFT